MIHTIKAYRIVEGSKIYHVAFDGYMDQGDVVIINMDGDVVMAKVVPTSIGCDGCPFRRHTCTVRNDSLNKILCHRSDGSYVGFEPLDNMLEDL